MPSFVNLGSTGRFAVPRRDPAVAFAKRRMNIRNALLIRRRLVMTSGAVFLFGGIAVGVSRLSEIQYALGIGPFDTHLSEQRREEIEQAARRAAIRPRVQYPARILQLLTEAETEGKDLTRDFETFRRAWGDRFQTPCEIVLIMQNWEYQNPISGSVTKRTKLGGRSRVDPKTGDGLTPVEITRETWHFLVAIAKIRQESGGTGRGVDRLSGYEYEPIDNLDSSQGPHADQLP